MVPRRLRATTRVGRLPVDSTDAAVSVHELTKVFHHHGGDVVHALESVSMDARPGELVGLVGRSGSGKTTLLNVIAGWERPSAGEVRWREQVDASIARVVGGGGHAAEARTDGGAHRRGEHRVSRPARGHARGTVGRRSRSSSTCSDWGSSDPGIRARPRWGSSSGPRSLARSRSRRACCSRTSPPRTRTPRRRSASSLRSAAPPTPGTAVVVATHNPEVIRHLDRVLTMADGHLEEAARG